tara:strand:+ start:516 stop:1040 length:525 start_codon:yes stop_codon:yes gene_type:complete
MALYDFFLSNDEYHLRELVEFQRLQMRRNRNQERRNSRSIKSVDKKIEQLEHDLGFVSLLLASVMELLNEKGVVKRTDVREILDDLDLVDGVKDGKIDINMLRVMTKSKEEIMDREDTTTMTYDDAPLYIKKQHFGNYSAEQLKKGKIVLFTKGPKQGTSIFIEGTAEPPSPPL